MGKFIHELFMIKGLQQKPACVLLPGIAHELGIIRKKNNVHPGIDLSERFSQLKTVFSAKLDINICLMLKYERLWSMLEAAHSESPRPRIKVLSNGR